MPYISIAAVSPRQVPHHTGDTCSSPPFRIEGTRSVWSRIDGIPKNSAIDRSSNSDKGHPAAAYKESQSKEGKASKSQRRVPFQSIFISLLVDGSIQNPNIPRRTNMARRACFISASRYSSSCSLFFDNPSGSKPTLPARSQFKSTSGHFTNGIDSEDPFRFTVTATGLSDASPRSSAADNGVEILVCRRDLCEGAKALTLAQIVRWISTGATRILEKESDNNLTLKLG
jgi:hypothetical protein